MRRRRPAVAAAAAVILALTLPASGWCGTAGSGSAISVEEALRRVLRAAAAGDERAPHALLALQQAVIDLRAGFPVDDRNVHDFPRLDEERVVVPGNGCLEKVEAATFGALFDVEPEALRVVHGLYLDAYAIAIRPPYRRWLAERAMRKLEWLTDRHRELYRRLGRSGGSGRQSGQSGRSGQSGQSGQSGRAGREERSLLLLAQADELQRSGFIAEIDEARVRFAAAAELGFHTAVAFYWEGVLSELLGDWERAAEAFSDHRKDSSDDAEVELRLGVNQARLGKRGPAKRRLGTVARGAAPSWVRIVAFQELVRLERGGPAAVRALLEEALAAFPAERGLLLQLAARTAGSFDSTTDWRAFDRALAAAGTAAGSSAAGSPRLSYDVPRRQELDAARRELGVARREARAGLAKALDQVEATVDDAPLVEACPGVPSATID